MNKSEKMIRATRIINALMPFYDGASSKDWLDTKKRKYIISRNVADIYVASSVYQYHFISFKTSKGRDLFFKEHKSLIKDYFGL